MSGPRRGADPASGSPPSHDRTSASGGYPPHGGNLGWAAERFGIAPDRFVDFSANINPLGPPPAALAAIAAELGRLRHYPDPDCRAAAVAVATYLGVPCECVLVTNGGAEAIELFARWLGPRRVAIAAPAFGEYADSVRRAGGTVETCLAPPGERRTALDAFERRLRACGAGVICNPNNPTGELLPASVLRAAWRRARPAGARLLLDEAFIDFVPRPERWSLRQDAAADPALVVVGSLTKFFALPGLRIGYAVAHPETLRGLRSLQPAWSVNALAQAAAVAALADVPYRARARRLIARERRRLTTALAQVPGFRPYPSAANFVLVDCRGTGRTAAWWRDALGPHGLLIRDCANFEGLDAFHLRVAVRLRGDAERLTAALRELAGQPV